MAEDFDVAVVGASVAGCAAARLFAQAGARVALLERRSDPAAYKVTCTHAILPPATPTLERLGVAPLLTERGVPRPAAEFWTPYGGWFGVSDDAGGWGVTRRTLDPLLRNLTVNTPGVEFFSGWSAKRVIFKDARPVAVRAENRNRQSMVVRAPLLVGADGRASTVARLAGVPGRVRPHHRFFYFAYWRGIERASARRTSIRLWLLEPHGAAEFPNEDDLTLLVATYHRAQLPAVRADLEGSYMRTLASLPDGPCLDRAQRVSKFIGKVDVPNVIRPAARPGIAFVGDAALAADPVFGVGISFALQSAQWLVDETSAALGGGPQLDDALVRYRRKFAWRLGPHHLQMADFSARPNFRRVERVGLYKATMDPQVNRALSEVLTRARSPFRLLDPRVAARLVTARSPQAGSMPNVSRLVDEHTMLEAA